MEHKACAGIAAGVTGLLSFRGFSLGPEVPTGMLAAGLGSRLLQLAQIMDAESTRHNVISGTFSRLRRAVFIAV